jgi:hypothetical protein
VDDLDLGAMEPVPLVAGMADPWWLYSALHGRLAALQPRRYHADMAAVPSAQVPGSAWEGTETVYFPHGELGGELLSAIHQAVPDGATYGVNHDLRRAWVRVSKPGNTREVLRAAFASLGRDLPGDPDDN